MSKAPSKAPSPAPGPSRAPTSVAPPSLPTGTRAPSVAPPSLATGSRAPGPPTAPGSRPPQSIAQPASSTAPPGSVVPPSTAPRGSIAPSSIPEPRPRSSVPPSSAPRASVVSAATVSSRALRGTVLPTAFLGTIPESSTSISTSTNTAATTTPSTYKRPTSIIPTSRGGTLKSIYTAPEDLAAASRQTMYDSLREEERILQDKWAKRKADQMAPCPADLLWVRHATHPGYRCTGGTHYVSDDMIAEGNPGVYTRRRPPAGLRDEMVPAPGDNIPQGYVGPVRPEQWDSVEERWIYPRWS